MQAKKKFLLLRISIYLTGLLIIIWVIGFNVWEIKEKTSPLIQTENGNYIVYTDRNYDNATLILNFEKEITENLRVEIQKDFSVFSTHRKKGVYSKEELREKLFKNNPSRYPNGSFLNYNNNVYFIKEGSLRKLDTPEILDFFNLNKEQLAKISSEEFDTFSQKEPLTYQSIQKEFPEEVLIKKEGLFITGSSGYYPVYVSNLEKLQKELNFQIIIVSNQSTLGKCYKNKNSQAICEFNLNKSNSNIGDSYRIIISANQSLSVTDASSIKLIGSTTFREFWIETKKLFMR